MDLASGMFMYSIGLVVSNLGNIRVIVTVTGILYLISFEALVKEAFPNSEHGVTVGGQLVNMIG